MQNTATKYIDPAVAEQIHCQQFYHWENRARLKQPAAANGANATAAAAPAAAQPPAGGS